MRKITKLLTLALAALMIMGAMPVSAAFTDVSVDDEALFEAVELLSTLGVAKGTTDTTFGPEELVTRQQMAAFVYRLMKAGRSSEGGVNTTPFTDLKDSTFFNMISWAANAGIIKGTSATTFNPTGNITLQDAYVMVVRALGYEKDGPLAYPHAYVDQAEAIGLDDDIPSTVDYTDNLNRGQVAIILANAFYADMNEKTVEYDWVYDTADGKPATGANAQYVAKETTETIAHKIFGVVEETLFVTGTTHNTLGSAASNKALYDEKNDVEFVYGTRYDEDGNAITGTTYEYKLEDLGLDGKSDDYFLDELTLFVKKDDKAVKDDVIIAAKSNLVKKTIKASDVVLERTSKTDEEYYVGKDKKNGDKVLTGYVELGGLKAYLDLNNAPYSYTSMDGAKSLRYIDLTGVAYDEEGNTTYEYSNLGFNFDGQAAQKDATSGAYDVLTNNFEAAFTELYNNGLFEAEVYDVNGDTYADYLFVKTFEFVQIIDKKNRDYAGVKTDSATGIKYINTEDAVVEGEYKSEDFVLAYLPYTVGGQGTTKTYLPYVKVIETINPINERVTTISKTSTKSEKATFANGTVVEFVNANEKFADAITRNAFTAGKTYKVYVKDDILLLNTTKTSTEFDTTADYAIVLPQDDGTYIITTQSIDDGEYAEKYFVKVVIGGAVKTVQLADYANLYTHYDNGNMVANNPADIDSQKITEKAIAEKAIATLGNKFSTFTNTTSGAYTFTEVKYTEASAKTATELDAIFDNTEDETAVYYTATSADFAHFTGSIYTATGFAGVTKFNVKDYSKLIIKSKNDDGEDVYTVYDASNLSKFDTTTFKNVKAVFINNTTSKDVEDLGIIMADVDKFAANETQDYRKVIAVSTIANEDNKSENVYTILNIKDGTTTANVKSAVEGKTFTLNDYVVLDEAGEIDTATTATAYAENKLVTGKAFASYDKTNKFLSVGDGNTYILDEDVTILMYIDSDEYKVVDEDALDNEDNPYEELEDANKDENGNAAKALYVDFIATDDDDSKKATIKHVNTIVITIK